MAVTMFKCRTGCDVLFVACHCFLNAQAGALLLLAGGRGVGWSTAYTGCIALLALCICVSCLCFVLVVACHYMLAAWC
jgi:hypothetical protein